MSNESLKIWTHWQSDKAGMQSQFIWQLQLWLWAEAVLRGGQGGHGPPVRAVAPCAPQMKLLQGNMPVYTVWHRIAGVKLHHSLNHVLCHPEFLPPKYTSGHPAGHPKLLQLETPLTMRITSQDPDNLYCVGGDVKPCSINQSINQSWG